jgi:hypothetical protein
MATKTLLVTFDSATSAGAAVGLLRRFGVGSAEMRLEGHRLHALVDDAYYALAANALRDAGALRIEATQNKAGSGDWISHHSGTVTSPGVPPGQGDAEAGQPD